MPRKKTSPFLLALALAACAHAPAPPTSSPADVIVPPHPAPVAPGSEVPPAVAPLAGAWEGHWSNGGPLVLVVYRLGPERARILIADGSLKDPANPPWHAFYSAEVTATPAPSVIWREGPATFRFSLDGTDRLRGATEGVEGAPTAELRRRPITLLAAAPEDRPLVCPDVRADLAAIEAAPPQARGPLVEAFEARARAASGPIVGPSARPGTACAMFIWRGEAREVALSGDMNGWSRDRDRFTRVAGTDLFVIGIELPADARLDYKLLIDGRWTLDPLNPRTMLGGYGPNSELALPAYHAPPEVTRGPMTPRGTIESLPLVSRHLGNRRKAQVYLPPGYAEDTARYPVLYLHDGEDELAFGAIDVILDELIARRALPPLIAVLVPPLHRGTEYGRNPAFEAFFLEEVVPAVDARYRTVAAPAGRIVGGASWGALAALSLGLGHPDVFGGVLAHSGAYGVHLPELVALARSAGSQAPAVWIDVGVFEEDMNGSDLLSENRRLRDALTAASVRVHYLEVPEGHSWGSWRARKREALGFLLGAMGAP